MMCFLFRRKPKPDLIDLHKYEHECMRWVRNGVPVRPPSTIFAMAMSPSEDDKAIMRDNRAQAQEIYEAYK